MPMSLGHLREGTGQPVHAAAGWLLKPVNSVTEWVRTRANRAIVAARYGGSSVRRKGLFWRGFVSK
jgi:hypothetical protein